MLECTELIAKMYLISLRYFGIYIFFLECVVKVNVLAMKCPATNGKVRIYSLIYIFERNGGRSAVHVLIQRVEEEQENQSA